MSTTSSGLSRRTIVKGAAWSVPIVAVAGAAPAMASSPPPGTDPGLNGWVIINRESGDCIRRGGIFNGCRERECAVRYDGYRNGADYYGGTRLGLWVWDAHASEITAAPTLTFHLPYQISYWEAETGNSGWSLPVAAGRDDDGFYLYTTTYSGGYTEGTDANGLPEVELTGRPHFLGHPGTSCSSNRRAKITRAVGINGQTVAFTREGEFPGNAYINSVDQEEVGPRAESSTAGGDDVTSDVAPESPTPDEVEEVIEYATI